MTSDHVRIRAPPVLTRAGADSSLAGAPSPGRSLARPRASACTGGKDPNLVVAALLHDTIEDQEVPRKTIADIWGEDVAALVEEVSDDKSLDKEERKRRQLKSAPKKSDRAKTLKLADKISNLRCDYRKSSTRLVGKAEA